MKEKKRRKIYEEKELAEMLVNYFRMKPMESFGMKQLFTGLKLTTIH